MAKNAYGTDQNQWTPSDTSTFSQQSQNLAQQAGDAGINQGQINIEQGTAKAEQAAGQSGKNVAAGSTEVAKGAKVDPTMAQGSGQPPAVSPNGGSQPTIQSQYTVTQAAPNAPDTNVSNDVDTSTQQTFQDPIQAYLSQLFPNGIPPAVQAQLNAQLGNAFPLGNQNGSTGNAISDAYNNMVNNDTRLNPGPDLASVFQSFLNDTQQQLKNPTTGDVNQYKNFINNQLQNQEQDLYKNTQKGQNDLNQQINDKQQAISDYIDKLNQGLKDYTTRTQDLSNIGNQSQAEKDAIARNALLANSSTTGDAAFAALRGGSGNSKLNALSQQAQNAALQQAIGSAKAAQNADKLGQQALQSGQAAQAKGYTDANTSIQKNQTDTLNKLKDSGTAASKQLADYYNSQVTNLNKQEQDYVNKAQDTLKSAKIPEPIIQNAVTAFANSVQSYMNNNKLSDAQRNQMKGQLESIWRIAVGSNPSDIDFSNKIAGILNPIAGAINQ